MKIVFGVLTGSLLTIAALVASQNPGDTPDAHVARARIAAGDTYQNLFDFLCTVPGVRGGGAPGSAAPTGAPPRAGGPQAGAARGGARAAGAPDRSSWYVEPEKVFDNLYFVGQNEYSAWAVATTEGVILIDTLFDYSVEDEVINGLKTLGLDPATIRYAVVTHAHPDHHGGAKLLQERFKTRVIMSPADWDVLDRANGTKPTRDMLATDGQKLTLGDTTITLYITPGHTPGTISVVMPLRDGGRTHVAALWGGTGLNADRESLQSYVQSAQRFDNLAQKAGADIMMSNHTDWDGSKSYLARLKTRTAGSPHPYVVGPQGVRNFMTVAEECATARLIRLN